MPTIVNFAKTGDPHGAGLPKWAPCAAASDGTVDFATSGEAVPVKDPWGVEIDVANDAA